MDMNNNNNNEEKWLKDSEARIELASILKGVLSDESVVATGLPPWMIEEL
jgi:hypothetical protein